MTTVSATGASTGGLDGRRAVLTPHPSGAVVTTALGTTSKKMKVPVGEFMLPATESFDHYPLLSKLRRSYTRECASVHTKKVGMTTPVVLAAARPSLNPGPMDVGPGPSADGNAE